MQSIPSHPNGSSIGTHKFCFVFSTDPSDPVQWRKPVQDLRLGRQCQGVENGLHADEHLQRSGNFPHRCKILSIRIFLLHSR